MSVAVVTGGSAGVGRATARALAGAGFDVALLARGEAGLRGAADDVEQCGRRALAIPTDIADEAAVRAARDQVEAELGPIDAWVNNAMTTVFSSVWDVRPEEFRRAVEVTFLGQVWGTMAALEVMRPRDRGTIVNVGSALAFIGIPLQSAYCAAKFACRGFAESVRAELLHEGSRVEVAMVHLPAVNTPQFGWCRTTFDRHPQPVPPIYDPDVAARAIVEAVRTGRPSHVVGAWNSLLVGAGSVVPNVANHYASLAAWESQLTDIPLDPDRLTNLDQPVDRSADAGPNGIFGKRAHGLVEPNFLRSLPAAGTTFVRSAGRAVGDAVRWRRARRVARSVDRRH